jgi:hypothetical protein
MTDVQFGRLEDLPLRDAWKHEALSFTPWLAENIDHISAAIGIPLELTDTEVAVESFSADILARNLQDDTRVLIENQLEETDHKHLGQIMTYLAGLEAQTVVWIAPSFREPHLSAIRWLNQHTADGFSFFAMRLRVVRIGNSPFAPIFEIVEKPNDWDRRLSRTAQSSEGQSELTQFRVAFWDAYTAAYPGDVELGIAPSGASSTWMGLDGNQIIVVLWVGKNRVGIFVRGARGTPIEETHERLLPFANELSERLQARFGEAGNSLLGRDLRIDMTDQANWTQATSWLHDRLHEYRGILTDVIEGEA